MIGRILTCLVVGFVLTGTCGCAAMQNGSVLNPSTGPGTPYPCVGHADWLYCGDHTCCPNGSECAGENGTSSARCDATPYNSNPEWIQLKKPESTPRYSSDDGQLLASN